ncbi:MAG: MobA/MobL family protein [Rickettsia conorii subsp. raoultii]|uniref:MobA/MobL family protein n=1 Tax=Rickettsia conorii TaxID=781 RepID=UPI003AF17413
MALYHFHRSNIQRSKGQNAVAKAAYISASKLVYKTIDKETGEEISIIYDFTKKKGVVYSKIFVPEGFEDAAWLQDREQLWNAAEAREKREDSITGSEVEFSLPREVSKEQNIKLVEVYVQKNIVSRGIVCDVNIHYDDPDNPHVHIQYFTRRLERLEHDKVVIGKVKDRELASPRVLYFLRDECEIEINKVYEEAGLPFRVTAKSYKTLGIAQEATKHRGVTHHMQGTELEAKNKEIIAENVRKIRENPEVILGKISYTKPVFTKEDIAIALSDALMVHLVSKGSDIVTEQEAIRAFGKGLVNEQVGGGNTEQNIANGVIATTAHNQLENTVNNQVGSSANNQTENTTNNPSLEHLNKEYGEEFLRLYNQLLLSDKIELMDQKDLTGKTLYALKSRVNLERRYVSAIEELNIKDEHNLDISSTNIGESKSFKERLLGVGSKTPEFSDEQIKAILSVCNGSDISVLEGNPGAGKTFVMREIVRQYKAVGFKVVGTGPSSVSAKVLSRNAGIKADNTSLLRKKIVESKGGDFKIDLSSKYYEEEEYLKSIGCDSILNFLRSDVLDSKTVLIVDEASMIELANMDYLAHEVLRAKAKLVLVGDNNQFTAVGMTGAFNKARKIAGGVKLTEVRRQERLEYRQATEAMGRFAMQEAIEIYRKLDVFNIKDNEEEAKTSLVTSFAKEYTEQIDHLKRDDLIAIRSIAIGAYTNEKVAEFNSRVRNELKNNGALKGAEVQISSGGRMLPLMKGDQIVFEENSLRYGISNGEVGTILSVKPFGGSANSKGDGVLRVLVHKADGSNDIVNIDTAADAANNKRRIKLNHGYALTGYKLQGETVDRLHVYFDRSIGYEAFLVLMSRHRQYVKLHASAQELEDIVYQRPDSDAEKVRNQFKMNSYAMLPETVTNEDGSSYAKHMQHEIPNWLIGLILAVSRRANNSFAIDYRGDGTLDGNQSIIKEYLEARVRVFECHGKMREWKRDIESVGNITRLYSSMTQHATNLKSIKLDGASPTIAFELELNIKDLKIDPYSIALSEAQDSFKYVVENILKEAREKKSESAHSSGQESTKLKAIKGVTYTDGKACINFKELDSKHQSKIIAICLKEQTYENLKEIFEELKLEKEVLRDYASVICDSYHSVVSAEDAKEFKKLILAKKDETKLLTESKVEARALTREKNFSQSEERKVQLEEQITIVKEQSAKFEEKLEATDGRISNRLSLIKENTIFTSDSVLMSERTIQLNINYETLRKHAGHDTYKYYLQDITEKSTISNCKAYQDLILLARDTSGDILADRNSTSSKQISTTPTLTSNNIDTTKAINNLNRKIQKALASIDSYVFDNKELIELKRSDLAESKKNLSDLRQEEQVIGNFVQTLFPHYLGRIYEQQGAEIIEKWEVIKASNSNIDVQALIERVKSNPSILGKLPGIGLGTIFGVSSSRRKSIEQVSKLGQQLLKYEDSMARLKEIENNDLIKEQEQKIVVLKEELNVLGSLKASKAEEKFLSNLKTIQAGSGLNIKSFKSLIESDEVQDLLCEYYNNQNEQYTRINEPDRAVVEQEDIQSVTTNSKTNTLLNTRESTSRSKPSRESTRTKEPALHFDKVQDALTSSDIERIFRQYAASIRGGVAAIKRSGSEISMGSLSMNLSKGTWIRHSSGKGGNIFGFVQEGAHVSKRQSLEIVAELAQLRAESNSYDYRAHVANSRANKEQTQEHTQQKPANEWIVAQDKITNADIFDPNRHLKGMMQHNTLEAVYTYKDANDKLLGYVVRFVGKDDGKKQTLPVTYCYNAAKYEQAWRLKGFTDKGDKPIFGIEKAICSSKTILVVEGEKAAITASKILPDYSVVSWMGGSNAADKVNWGQLQWRDVIIWPDNDEAGFKAAEVIKDKINKANDHIGFVSVVDPKRLQFGGSTHKDLLPAKWDLADRLPEGMTTSNVKEVIENVRAAHLDVNQIQNVIQSTNASDASQQLVERNIWQEAFKGKVVNGEKITALSANEFKAATFFSSEEASNYVKYLEATGKGSVAHDYLKYDSPMYQDILTSLATRDEHLSESIISLSNSNNTSDISTDTETIETKTKLIDDTQNLYEKKALEYGGIAGTHAVYRDYLELMIKNCGESHGKVTLYKDIVRDVSILHSAQLGMNIHDLPDSYHKEIARDMYSTISEWNSRYALDATDKNKITHSVYEEHCTLKAWEQKSYEQVATSHKVYAERQKRLEQTRLADIERETERKTLIEHTEQIKNEILISQTVSEVFGALEKDQKFFVAQNGNIKYTTFNYEFVDLAEKALEYKEHELLPKLKDVVESAEQYGVFSTQDILAQLKDSKDLEETYKHFDSSLESHQLETQHQQIIQDKVDAKTTDEMLTAISREHEFFKSLDGKLKYPEKYDSSILSAISNAKTIEQDTLITNMHNMVVYAQKHGILNDQDILDQFNSNDSRNALNNLSKTCQKHYMDHHNENIKQLLDDEHVMVGTKKYTCPLKYMKHEIQNNIPSFVDEKQIANTFTKVKAEVKELHLERELEHTMTMRF